MATYDATQEVYGELTDKWSGLQPDIPWYPWEKTDPAIGADIDMMFMLVEFMGGQGLQKSMGAPGENWWAEISTFNLHMYYPAGESADAARLALQDAATIFRGVTRDVLGGGTMMYRAPFPPQAGRESTLTGNWMSLSMAVPYEYRILA